MKPTPLLIFYNKIMCAKDESDIEDLTMELQAAVITNTITDDSEIMLLNMALQIRSNYFIMKEVILGGGNTTVMIMGDVDDFDPEQMQLDDLYDKELDDFKDGNVLTMKDFGKKKE